MLKIFAYSEVLLFNNQSQKTHRNKKKLRKSLIYQNKYKRSNLPNKFERLYLFKNYRDSVTRTSS